MSNTIIGTRDNLNELISNEKTTLIDFWAPWCGPCKVLGPILDKIAEENPEIQIIKVDVDENSEISSEYGIRNIPTVLVFKGGAQVDKFVGMKSKEDILKLI
jgi:thioredoxin 1